MSEDWLTDLDQETMITSWTGLVTKEVEHILQIDLKLERAFD